VKPDDIERVVDSFFPAILRWARDFSILKLQIPKIQRPSAPPRLVAAIGAVLFLVLIFNAFTIFADFPLNGNPMAWLKAQDFYHAAIKSRKSCDLQTACRKLQEAISIYNRDPRYHLLLGEHYLRLKRYDDALACFSDAVKLKPGDAYSWKMLSRAFAMLDRQ